MIQNTVSMNDLARVGFHALINKGLEKATPTHQRYIGATIRSRQAFELFAYHGGLGLFQQRDEGDRVKIDSVAQRYRQRVTPVIHSLGLQYTKQAQYKDLYDFIKSQGPLVAHSATSTINLLAANTFMNFAFPGGSSNSPDGVTLFNSAHPTQGSTTQSNLGTSVISYFSLEDALTAIAGQTLDREDLPRMVDGGFKLLVTPWNHAAAVRAVKSTQVAGTNANDTSEFVSGKVKDIVEDPYIGYQMSTMRLAWALVPMKSDENPHRFMQIEGLRTHVEYEGKTDTTSMFAHFENTFFTMGWQGTFGSKP